MQSSLNLWLWLTLYVILLLFMVYAMMEFTVSLLAKRPPHDRPPITAEQLRIQIVALEEEAFPYRLFDSTGNGLEFRWVSANEKTERGVRSQQQTNQSIHVLLDEDRHEVRVCETASSSGYFAGVMRWIPHISAYAGYSAGPPGMTDFIKRMMAVTHDSGWTFRPVILPFQTSERSVGRIRMITPPPLRKLPPSLLWGILYPLSYCLAFAWFFAFGGPEMQTTGNLLLLFLISVCWWGLWALMAWMLCGFPLFWRGEE